MTREVKDIITISYFRPFKDMIDVDVELEKLFHSVSSNPGITCSVRDTATGRAIAIGSYAFCRVVYQSMKDAGHLSLEDDVIQLAKEGIISDSLKATLNKYKEYAASAIFNELLIRRAREFDG